MAKYKILLQFLLIVTAAAVLFGVGAGYLIQFEPPLAFIVAVVSGCLVAMLGFGFIRTSSVRHYGFFVFAAVLSGLVWTASRHYTAYRLYKTEVALVNSESMAKFSELTHREQEAVMVMSNYTDEQKMSTYRLLEMYEASRSFRDFLSWKSEQPLEIVVSRQGGAWKLGPLGAKIYYVVELFCVMGLCVWTWRRKFL